jgi:hypothetical protein
MQTKPILLLACLLTTSAFSQTTPTSRDVITAGAKPDGATDNTAIFQRLLDEAGKAGGGVVTVPAGSFRIAGNLNIPANVTLQGIYRVPPTVKSPRTAPLTGSVLEAMAGRGSAEGPPFINLAGDNAAIAGFIITYPEWKQTDVPPVPYPPCVDAVGMVNVGVSECLLLNPYVGIRLINAPRHIVRNVTGYPSSRGIYVDYCLDIGHIENVHFWPFGIAFNPDDPYCKWVNLNGIAFDFARTDWQYVLNTFCFGYGIGYKFSESKEGSANGNFNGLGADSCQRAVVVEQAQPAGLLITNGEFVGRWGGTDSVCLEIAPQVMGKVSLVNCAFWGPIDRCVWMRSTAGQFTASACNFVNWDIGNLGSPAIQLDAGKAIVQGCTFVDGSTNVKIGGKVVSAILNGNQASGGFRIENQAGRRTQSALNEEPTVVEWTNEALAHYRVHVGQPGDRSYLLGAWQISELTARWTGVSARLRLPVVPGKPCTITIKGNFLPQTISPAAGLYFEATQMAPLTAGDTLTAALPATTQDHIELELRSHGWVPQQLDPKSSDLRTLGVQVSSVEVRAADAGEEIFNANTGEWLANTSLAK